MVRGLDVFRRRFAGPEDRYVLIGGTAVDIAMDDAGLRFRATKDLDIVLHVESLDVEFARLFWAFVEDGRYKYRQKSTGKTQLFRFYEPEDAVFPYMIELFSRMPDLIEAPADSHLTPLPISEEVSSLSAILLDNDYYEFVQQGTRFEHGLSVLAPEYIVALKARAWIDLVARRDQGEEVSGDDIKKHRGDIIRLTQLIPPTERIALPESIRGDMIAFMAAALDEGAGPRELGVVGMTMESVKALLVSVYGLGPLSSE